jgi:hypothetical protein
LPRRDRGYLTADAPLSFQRRPGHLRLEPRPVRVPAVRRPGREWLNGPLVWAIDEDHDMLYLFPRECPRILLWPTPSTTEGDRWVWFGDSPRRALAFIERDWFGRLECALPLRAANREL